jgi:isopentenyl-diphosphate Delta-isomerase
MEQVILVNERDEEIGVEEKLRAHQNGGQLHRAFSIFLFNEAGELLMQRRAAGKYHFGGLWSNTCCGHPRPGESVADAALRRLGEEFGISAPLAVRTTLIYGADDPASGLSEREFLHIFSGRFDGEPEPNRAEVGHWRWLSLKKVRAELADTPMRFTPWFPLALAALDGAPGGL